MTSKKTSVLDAPAPSLKELTSNVKAQAADVPVNGAATPLADAQPPSEPYPYSCFWLVTATVDIKAPNAQNDDDAHMGPQRINFPISTEDGNIRNHTLSVIRGLAAHGVVDRLGLPTTRIASVIIDNITALGFMLEQDFFGVPEAEPEAAPAPEVVDDAGATQPFVES